ncbi:MAG: NifB/NifX family molybdenum-iron cluster-binding protein [Spirochaetia bacterium]
MIIAVPLAAGKLAMHFGHCEQFALIEIDESENKITNRRDIEPPPHEPGLLPRFLSEQGAGMIIAGGMGRRAQALFSEQGIRVITGAPAETPENLVQACLDGTLVTGENACGH